MKILSLPSKRLSLAGALNTLVGGAPVSPSRDRTVGNSVNALTGHQTMGPSASANTATPALDGNAARKVIDRYYKTYTALTLHQNVVTVGVGSIAH